MRRRRRIERTRSGNKLLGRGLGSCFLCIPFRMTTYHESARFEHTKVVNVARFDLQVARALTSEGIVGHALLPIISRFALMGLM